MGLPFNSGGLFLTSGTLAGTLDRRFASSDGLDAIEGRWRAGLALRVRWHSQRAANGLAGLACSRRRIRDIDRAALVCCAGVQPRHESTSSDANRRCHSAKLGFD